MTTEGEVKFMVRSVTSQDGIFVWQRQYLDHKRRTMESVLRMHKEVHPKLVKDISQLISSIVAWEDKWDRMAKEHATDLPHLLKTAAFRRSRT